MTFFGKTTFIEFDDYCIEEMIEILDSMCRANDYQLDYKLKDMLKEHFEEIINQKDESFANGRLARNLYDDLIMKHAKRVVNLPDPSEGDLSILTVDDFI